MKGFLRSKLVLTLAALIMIAAVASIPFASSITRSHAASPSSRQVFFFLKGETSTLSDEEIAHPERMSGFGKIHDKIKSTPGFSGAEFFAYSYAGLKSGTPLSYHCDSTVDPSLSSDIVNLQSQINAVLGQKPGVDTNIYLIGHSVGGVVAFGYLAFLMQSIQGVALPSNAHLKAVITLDAPLGGMSNNEAYASLFQGYITFSCLFPVRFGANLATIDLFAINRSASQTPPPDDAGTDPLGAQASVLAISSVGRHDFSNEQLAEQAQANGTSVLAIGDTNDFVFNTKPCNGVLPNFADTQYLEDEGDGTGLYGRSFTSTSITCTHLLDNVLNKCTDTDILPGDFTDFPPAYLQCVVDGGFAFFKNVGNVYNSMHDSHGLVQENGAVLTGISTFLASIPTTGIGGTPGLTPQPVPDTSTGAKSA